MTEKKQKKRRRLAHEILGLIGISALMAAVVFWFLVNVAAMVAEVYCFENDLVMTESDWMAVDTWIFSVGAVVCAGFFSLLFLSLLGDRLTYVRTLTRGIEALRMGEENCKVPLEGNNELTELADAINYLSATQRQVREKERALAQEKEQLIRTLSHDIRTPLTTVLALSEYLAGEENLSPGERQAHLATIRSKAEQIRDLTEILLDGGRRSPEHFDDARLLMWQLAEEFEEGLDGFAVNADLSGCPAFAGTFDAQELRRIFDNLVSNIRKYADPSRPVNLKIRVEEGQLHIRQTNAIAAAGEQADSYRLGITSIRRIAQHYGGSVNTREDRDTFEITVVLSDF